MQHPTPPREVKTKLFSPPFIWAAIFAFLLPGTDRFHLVCPEFPPPLRLIRNGYCPSVG